MLKIFVFEVFHIVIFFTILILSPFHFWRMYMTFHSFSASSPVFISPVRITLRDLYDCLQKNPSFEMRCFIWEDWWCFWRHGLFTDPINAMDPPHQCDDGSLRNLLIHKTSFQISDFHFSNFSISPNTLSSFVLGNM